MATAARLEFAVKHAWGGGDGVGDEISRLGREYFTRLDLATNPVHRPPDPEMEVVVLGLRNVLTQRLFQRCRVAAGESLPGYDAAVVERISTLMLGLLRSVFGENLLDAETVDRIGKVHDRFSWGGLRRPLHPRIRIPNNVPDGAAIFMFPEFAHLAIEMDIDADGWTALLPILTRMPALYLRAHELADPAFAPKPFDDYGHPPEFDAPEADLYAHARTLASEYDGMSRGSLADALDGLVAKAFTLDVG